LSAAVAPERLQKLIAAAGLASRRKAEEMIVAGRVRLNGSVVRDLGVKADTQDEVQVDGRPLPRPEARVWIALHKPAGVVSSVSDPHAERVVVQLLGQAIDERVYPAGRLDRASEGLVLLTNDGELMHAMTRPGGPIDKEYQVEVAGAPAAEDLERLRAGFDLDGRRLLPCEIALRGADGRRCRLEIVLHEGKKNQIRRMCRAIGHPVRRLVRTRIGPIRLGGLTPGEWRHLLAAEVSALRRMAGLAVGRRGPR
jgi:pseudouridine synthase